MTRSAGWARAGCLTALLAARVAGTALAMDPDRALSQHVRDRWGAERGFPGGTVQAIGQTPDGYLWVATESALLRFDGVRFVNYAEPRSGPLQIPPVVGLAVDARGDLWIRLDGARLLRYHDGKVDTMPPLLRSREGRSETVPLERREDAVTAMGLGRDGGLLVVGILNGLLAWRETHFEPVASYAAFSAPSPVTSIAEAPDGTMWLGTRDDGLFRLTGGQSTRITKGLADRRINAVLPVGTRDVWIATDKGVLRWNGAEATARGLDPVVGRSAALTMTLDRDSNLWVGTASGLLRVNGQGASLLPPAAQSSPTAVSAIFEDREGSLWIGRHGELERLRDPSFITFDSRQGLPSDRSGPILVDGDRRTWFAPATGGLHWLRNGRVEEVRADGLPADVVYSIAPAAGGVWLGRRSGAITRLTAGDGGITARTYRSADGLADRAIYAVHESRDGTVWAGSLGAGLSRMQNGRFTTYTTRDGLASDTVSAIVDRRDGSTWVAAPDGVSAFLDGRWRVYGTREGLPSNEVNCLFEDSAGTLWIGTGDGIAFLDADRMQLPRGPSRLLRAQIFGLSEDGQGWLWVATGQGVFRARRAALRGGVVRDADLVEYGLSDGLYGMAAAKRHRSVVSDPAGRIWFSMDRGLSVVDPLRAAASVIPVLSRITSLSADGSSLEMSNAVRVPPASRRVTFTYSGVSLSAPEGIRFRYRLDGFDDNWSEPVTTREAVYTNLSPGAYRFRVTATIHEDLWQGSEADLGIVIAPTLWQAGWFRLSAGLAVVLALVAAYRLRLRRITRQMTVRFEDRLEERTRIAQELHDTLLQGFISASMQLHVAVDQVAAGSPARSRLDGVLALIARVIDEGRNAVRGLRSGGEDLDLEQAFSRVRDDLRIGDEIDFRVIGEGERRPLHPMVRDDVYRIGREALVNAIRHADATRIEVAVECAPRHLRVLVRDDGRGIDPEVLRAGRDGHWGLSGMRERAERVGGQLRVWSRPGAGTEVELSVPGHVAFRDSPVPPPLARPGWLGRWKRRIPRSRDSETGRFR